jgi:hypothetical protein
MRMPDEADIALATLFTAGLDFRLEDKYPLRPARKARIILRWTQELESLRREVRRLFNRCRTNNQLSWDLYREVQWRYKKEIRKTSKETWRTFRNSVKELPRSASLRSVLRAL